MFTVLWFLFIAFFISLATAWLVDHDGLVIINWLGYEVKTDILVAILVAVLITVLVFLVSYLIARILAIKFPNVFKIFFRRLYLRKLEKLVHRYRKSQKIMLQLLLATEAGDIKAADGFLSDFSAKIKNPKLNNFFLGKIAFKKGDFAKAADLFAKFGEDKNAKILVLKSKLEMALSAQDYSGGIAYAKQILSVKKDGDIAKRLFVLYKKQGLWTEARELMSEYGAEKFKDELQKRDVAIMNTVIALENYQKKNFAKAIKHAKIALKSEEDFLPALEINLKSLIKKGFAFKARWMIKSAWRENPHLVLAEIYDMANHKLSAKDRFKAIKKLSDLNSDTSLGKLAVGVVAFRIGFNKEAAEFLRLALLKEKTYRAYKLLSKVEDLLGNKDEAKKYLAKAHMSPKSDHYTCNSCDHVSSSWTAKCSICDSYDSLEWNN